MRNDRHVTHLAVFFQALILSSSLSAPRLSPPKPIDPAGWPHKFPAKEHCSKCGLCETSLVSSVVDACAFLDKGMSRIDDLERIVHGRSRTEQEGSFGVLQDPIRLAVGRNITDAQWTGVITSIALSMIESGKVDAVVCIAASNSVWSSPEPILARTAEDVMRGRGVKPALAPSLRVLDEIKNDGSIRKLLFCGVGCSVQAFRAIESTLGLEAVYVLGTNCVDNSPTPQAAEKFLQKGVSIEDVESVRGYEFMQDFRVHVKTRSNYITRPYFSLPASIAEPSIAKSCLSCFDYTNGLADVVVGYMGAPVAARMTEAWQTLTVRNKKGATMVETAVKSGRLLIGEIATGHGNYEKMVTATLQSDTIVQSSILGNPLSNGTIPFWIGELLAFVLRATGPKGLHFAKYSIDYHVLRNYFYVLYTWGEDRARDSMPQYAKDLVDYYLKTHETLKVIQGRISEKTRI